MAKTFALVTDQGGRFPTCYAFDRELKGQKAVVLFIGPNCPSCPEYLVRLAEMGEVPETAFAVINIAECDGVAHRYGVEVVPTIMLKSRTRRFETVPLTGKAKEDVQALKLSLQGG